MAAPQLVESPPAVNSNLFALLALSAVTGLSAQHVERNIPYRPDASAEQHLDLYAPAGATQAPVVLFIHGGSLEESGERRSSPMYAPVCPGLVARGMVCATMDYRLSPSFRWPAMPEDVAAAVRWLEDSVASRGGDPHHIVLAGHSSGCLLAALVALDSIYLKQSGLTTDAIAGVVAMGCTLAPWDTAGKGINPERLAQRFARDDSDRQLYGTLAWRLRANPTAWIGPTAPPFLVLVAESERFFPSILEEGAHFVCRMRELERSADIRILSGRRHITTTTGFADAADPVANLVADFVRDPAAVTATP
jgi:acetyl esterase/lipase